MRPVRIEIPGGDNSEVVPLDWYQDGPVSLAVVNVDGTVDITLQYTLDDVFSEDFDPSTANWFEIATGITAAQQEDLGDTRPTAVRATNGAAGTAELQVVQSGTTG